MGFALAAEGAWGLRGSAAGARAAGDRPGRVPPLNYYDKPDGPKGAV